jgi:hypothetical protein
VRAGMRFVFVLYATMIMVGLAFFITIGLIHH